MARTPIHPGEILREELEILGVSAAEFARQLNVPTKPRHRILNEKRAVTADTALRWAIGRHQRGNVAEFAEALRTAPRLSQKARRSGRCRREKAA